MDYYEKLMRLPDGTSLGHSGGFIEVNNAKFYHEVHGDGRPLLLMHGAWATIESLMFQVGPLSERFKVILVERRGHGRTPDTPGRFTYRQGAEDMVAVLNAFGHDHVDIAGWSDGAVIGLLMARNHTEIVRRYISIGGSYHFRGYTREFARSFEESSPESLDPVISQVYGWTSPDGPEHFPVVFEKIKSMSSSHPRLTKRDLGSIVTPTLVMSGDNDIVSLEHTVNFYRGLPHGFLSILPGSTHMLPMEKGDMVNEQIVQFLEADKLERADGNLFRS